MSQRLRPKRTGEKLLAIRQRLGVSQTGMKHLLNFKGDYGRISDYELGKRFPNVLTLLAYARVAGIHVDDLVDDSVALLRKGALNESHKTKTGKPTRKASRRS